MKAQPIPSAARYTETYYSAHCASWYSADRLRTRFRQRRPRRTSARGARGARYRSGRRISFSDSVSGSGSGSGFQSAHAPGSGSGSGAAGLGEGCRRRIGIRARRLCRGIRTLGRCWGCLWLVWYVSALVNSDSRGLVASKVANLFLSLLLVELWRGIWMLFGARLIELCSVVLGAVPFWQNSGVNE
jgi:hypothetical protein